MRPLSPIREFNWSQANRRVRQERAKLDSKDSRDICAPHDRPEHRAGIVFHLKLTLMARLRFYGSLVTISIRIRPTFCRTFRFGFLLCSNASGVLQAHAYIPFPIFSALSSSTYETEPPTRLEAVRITFHLFLFPK